mmetsp:Transcript_18421/g.31504  ORF Transcript_18421/g.31504 Transcript_18421/m.31504 type:complete len:220 (-) Transcript_18421:14-673(-)
MGEQDGDDQAHQHVGCHEPRIVNSVHGLDVVEREAHEVLSHAVVVQVLGLPQPSPRNLLQAHCGEEDELYLEDNLLFAGDGATSPQEEQAPNEGKHLSDDVHDDVPGGGEALFPGVVPSQDAPPDYEEVRKEAVQGFACVDGVDDLGVLRVPDDDRSDKHQGHPHLFPANIKGTLPLFALHRHRPRFRLLGLDLRGFGGGLLLGRGRPGLLGLTFGLFA